MKSTTKKIKPSYIVNMDEIHGLEDIDIVFTMAKQDAGLPLNDEDIKNIVTYVADNVHPEIRMYTIECSCDCTCDNTEVEQKPKRKPWYKRFWNWMLGRK